LNPQDLGTKKFNISLTSGCFGIRLPNIGFWPVGGARFDEMVATKPPDNS
jgi:hypothetical protein